MIKKMYKICGWRAKKPRWATKSEKRLKHLTFVEFSRDSAKKI